MTVVGVFISVRVGLSALMGHLYTIFIWLGILGIPFKDYVAMEDRREKLQTPNVEARPPGFRSRWERLMDIEELINMAWNFGITIQR